MELLVLVGDRHALATFANSLSSQHSGPVTSPHNCQSPTAILANSKRVFSCHYATSLSRNTSRPMGGFFPRGGM
jgi:hypothetical protein